MGRFLNADAFVSTGQGELGNNMFAYCLNNPIMLCDSTGAYAQIWPILFDSHDPGFIHRAVQAHIIATGLFQKELYLAGVGRADIFDPKTGEIWEIKHGGSNADGIATRTTDASNQVLGYIGGAKEKLGILLQEGHAGAFTGGFVINCNNISYFVTYETPAPGVILYFVRQMRSFEPAASFAFAPAMNKRDIYTMGSIAAIGAIASLLGGGCAIEPLMQTAYAN